MINRFKNSHKYKWEFCIEKGRVNFMYSAKNNANNEQINTRLLVLEMLLSVTKPSQNGQCEYSHVVVREVLNKYNYLSQQEKAFIKRLFEGTLERMIELDYVINLFSNVKVNKMKPVIRTIMRMGVYQILYMDAIPDAAACNEAVKLAQKKGFSTLKGFVNGVLRNIARNKEGIEYPSLAITYSMPEWITDMWIKQLGDKTTEKVLKGLLAEHPVTIRFRNADSIKTDVEAVEAVIKNQGGVIEKHPYLDYAYRIYKTDDITRLPGFKEGAFVIQDVSSMLAVEAVLANIQNENIKVLDVCAAPGGKSMLTADLLEKKDIKHYSIEARDISENKVQLMSENFERCRLNNAKAVVWDATETDDAFLEQADIVIADIPCSGLGIMGKKRDIKYKMTPESIKEIEKLQKQILKTAVKYLKAGGRLLFSTCTINAKENEENFEWIKNELGLKPVSLDKALFGNISNDLHSATIEKGYIQLLPGIHDTDGFFISVFEK